MLFGSVDDGLVGVPVLNNPREHVIAGRMGNYYHHALRMDPSLRPTYDVAKSARLTDIFSYNVKYSLGLPDPPRLFSDSFYYQGHPFLPFVRASSEIAGTLPRVEIVFP
jgi:hypothetical protein